MIPYGYRRISQTGLDSIIGATIWQEMWPDMRHISLERLSNAVAVDVSPITYILLGSKKETKNLFPPWEVFYFEIAEQGGNTGYIFSEETGQMKEAKATARGFLVRSRKITEKEDSDLITQVNLLNIGIEGRELIDGWAYDVGSICYWRNHPAALTHVWETYVTSNGTLATDKKGFSFGTFEQAPGLKERMKKAGKYNEYNFLAMCNYEAKIVMRFVSFMQARNIKARPKHFPDYKPRKHQHHKVYKYYELVVVKPSINEISKPHGEGIKGKALHSVRGHIAHYTPENPLFGIASLYGDFFIHQHIRGNIQHGKIEKTYAVKEKAPPMDPAGFIP